jgi:uncharacterized protein YeaO (DUF488 family)
VKFGATGLIPAAENDRVAGEPAMNGTIKIKRAYDPVSKDDGYRILVGRLWPRGVSKQRAALDLWLRDIAPSTELREWFSHDPLKWDEFRKRYWHELEDRQKDVNIIKIGMLLKSVVSVKSAFAKNVQSYLKSRFVHSV